MTYSPINTSAYHSACPTPFYTPRNGDEIENDGPFEKEVEEDEYFNISNDSFRADHYSGWEDWPVYLSDFPGHSLIYSISIEFIQTVKLLFCLAIDLIGWIGFGLMAYFMTLRLILFALVLLPQFVRLLYWWWTCPFVRKGIQYGPNPRNFLDIYLPHPLQRKSIYLGNNQPPSIEQIDKHFPKRPSFAQISRENRRSKLFGSFNVIINIMGGAWIIGYKGWSAWIGRRLGVDTKDTLVVCPDYRNFPQGDLIDMMIDVNCAIDWTIRNIHLYGGDARKIFIVSQSAGAHLSTLVLLYKSFMNIKHSPLIELSNNPKEEILKFAPIRQHLPLMKKEDLKILNQLSLVSHSLVHSFNQYNWDPKYCIKSIILISGPYNLVEMSPILDRRGLNSKILLKLARGKLEAFSPTILSERFLCRNHFNTLPVSFHFFHGKKDSTVPYNITIDFIKALSLQQNLNERRDRLKNRENANSPNIQLELFKNGTHSSLIIEDAMRGEDELTDRLSQIVCNRKLDPRLGMTWPHELVDIAQWVMPFS